MIKVIIPNIFSPRLLGIAVESGTFPHISHHDDESMVAVVNLNPRLWSPRAIMHGLQHDECGNYTSCKISSDIRTLSILGAVSIRL